MLASTSMISRPQMGIRPDSRRGHGASSISSTRRVGTISSSLDGCKGKTREKLEKGLLHSIARIADLAAFRQSLGLRRQLVQSVLGAKAIVLHGDTVEVRRHLQRCTEEHHSSAPGPWHREAVPG